MIKKIASNISIPFFILILIGYFLPSKIFVYCSIAYFFFLLFTNKYKIPKNRILIPIVVIFTFGLINGLFRNGIYDVIRDIFTFSTPIFFSIMGMYLTKSKKNIVLTIVVSGIIESIFDMYNKVKNLSLLLSGSIGSVRTEIGYVSIVSVIALALLIYKREELSYYFNKTYKFFIGLLVLSVVLSFSRTNFVFLILILMPLLVSRITIKKIGSIVGLSAFILILFYVGNHIEGLDSILNSFIEKTFRSFTEVSTGSGWNDVLNIQQNWRGYEVYCAQELFKSGTIFEQLFGFGFGKGVYVGNYAISLGVNDSAILPRLHNGYYSLLIKNGLIGIVLYFLYFFLLIKETRKIKDVTNRKITYGLTINLIVLAYFSIGIFILGGMFFESQILIYFYMYSNRLETKNESISALFTTVSRNKGK